ncbi:cupin domain-containing protein [Plantactinospora sp. ZYX-F-223]|uniref:cupin domain-containing protein n=1 Tax=Plantactinospora sp. ZYX-F-223 TaxID=3144103 RepID=UPI0031FC4E77
MSLPVPIPDSSDPRWTNRGGILVRNGEGIVKWVAGDTYTIKVTAADTNGSLGFVETTVPPGAGPVAHAHGDEDEAFYLLIGELEFLNGDETFVAGPGDFVFIPRGNRHRFKNISTQPAKMLFLFTPGGHEGTFIDIGDDPQPGKESTPWGPENYAKAWDSLVRYNVTLLPEAQQ